MNDARPPAAETDGSWLLNFPGHVIQWQVVCVAIVVLAFIVGSMRHHGRLDLERAPVGALLTKIFAATSFPTGILLFLCAFDERAVRAVQDSKVYLSIAGGIVLFYSIKEMLKKVEDPPEPTDPAGPP